VAKKDDSSSVMQ